MENASLFYEDMGEPPDGLSLDRIDNNGNYEKNNCRWATSTQQNRNSSRAVLILYRDKKIPLMEFSLKTGIPYSTAWRRLKQGWSSDEIQTRYLRNE